MFENPRTGTQAKSFTTNVPKTLDLKLSSEQIFFENWRWVLLIEEFYPSISQDLLNKALDFVSNYDNITTEERNIIIHAKNSILIHKHIPWQKKVIQHST